MRLRDIYTESFTARSSLPRQEAAKATAETQTAPPAQPSAITNEPGTPQPAQIVAAWEKILGI